MVMMYDKYAISVNMVSDIELTHLFIRTNQSINQSMDRYCLDTFIDKNEWRRKGLETCFTCAMKTIKLKSVCIACARNCLFGYVLSTHTEERRKEEKRKETIHTFITN